MVVTWAFEIGIQARISEIMRQRLHGIAEAAARESRYGFGIEQARRIPTAVLFGPASGFRQRVFPSIGKTDKKGYRQAVALTIFPVVCP